MLTPETLRHHFELARPYPAYVATGTPDQQANFRRVYDAARLTSAQHALIASFTRRMPVLVTSGTWCGDCVNQCPLFARIAEANPDRIDLRFVDRDEHKILADHVRICGGHRVPTVIWMAEDFEFVHLMGDRTLTRYRAIAATQLGPACPVPGAAADTGEAAAVIQDWVNEFERVHLILRTSARLRHKHND
ncbi:MAG: thioredoxin family protein [Phycisphaerales bacterium]